MSIPLLGLVSRGIIAVEPDRQAHDPRAAGRHGRGVDTSIWSFGASRFNSPWISLSSRMLPFYLFSGLWIE